MEAMYTGPIPLPQIAAGWQRLVPDAPERMLEWVETETRQRHWMEKMFVAYRFAGLAGAFTLALVVVVGGVWLIDRGKDAYGLAAIISALATLAGLFIVRQLTSPED